MNPTALEVSQGQSEGAHQAASVTATRHARKHNHCDKDHKEKEQHHINYVPTTGAVQHPPKHITKTACIVKLLHHWGAAMENVNMTLKQARKKCDLTHARQLKTLSHRWWEGHGERTQQCYNATRYRCTTGANEANAQSPSSACSLESSCSLRDVTGLPDLDGSQASYI
jgi:hypothetical protein